MAQKKKKSPGKLAMLREAKKANLAEGKAAPKLHKGKGGAEKVPLAKMGGGKKGAKMAMPFPKGGKAGMKPGFPPKKKKKA
jgi:hypothetical protein